MSENDLENLLRELPEHGTLVKDRGYRQVWRFEFQGRGYYLKFYPRGGARDLFRRSFRGSPAMREFTRLQALQKAGIPAPRPVASMIGLSVNGRGGDAVVLEAIEPAIQLDEYLHRLEMEGEEAPGHLKLAGQVSSLVHQLGEAGLGHLDLHLGNFLLHNEKLYLLDGYAVRKNGLHLSDVMMLGHSVRRFAHLTDLVRGWRMLGPGDRPPGRNAISRKLWGRFMASTTRENRYFGRLSIDGWKGFFSKHHKYPFRWSAASQMEISAEDWRGQWPVLLKKMQGDELTVLKRSRSGDVLGGEIVLGGKPLGIVIKRPRRRYWYRYLNEIGRGARPRRAWRKAWEMILRGLPTAWPLLVMEKRVMGYVTDTVILFERVPGKTLAKADLAGMAPAMRENLFRRAGRLLRQIEQFGFSHFDAKASNWIVLDDAKLGPMPVLIDVDGIRRRRWVALGIRRLLRSMHENPGYNVGDSLALCSGYAPYARWTRDTRQTLDPTLESKTGS